MSFVSVSPEMVVTAAADVARIGSMVGAANAAALVPTTQLVAAAEDEVSEAIASLFGTHAREYQELGGQAATFHDRFVQTLTASAGAYSAADSNAVRGLLDVVNAPVQALLGRPLVGNGVAGAPGSGADGGAGGLLIGNGGAGGSGGVGQPGGKGGAAGLWGSGGVGGAGGAGASGGRRWLGWVVVGQWWCRWCGWYRWWGRWGRWRRWQPLAAATGADPEFF